jgi:hypothetical protein
MPITTLDNDIKERLSLAYVTAVAARAGCEFGEVHVDRNGIDGTIRAIRGTPVKIDVQLKATAVPQFEGGHFPFDLDVPEYDLLRATVIQAPQLLIVLALPQDAQEWLWGDEQSMALRRCAYWENLCGRPAVDNTSTIRVHIPRVQMFHADALRELMERTHAKALLGETGI